MNHYRAVRFFWGFLLGATAVSLIGNVVHAVLPYVPRIVVQIGAASREDRRVLLDSVRTVSRAR